MDYILNRESLDAGEIIYDGCMEQPVDLDISLPDYCPDIQRVLKCQVYPSISTRNITADRLEIEGSYNVKVFYLDAAGAAVRCCENSSPFFVSTGLKQNADNAQVMAFTRVEYINCRATSPRRLDIHGAFSVCARILSIGEAEIISGIEGGDVEQQQSTLPFSRVAAFSQQQFSIEETLELPSGKPAAETVLRHSTYASLQDYKVVANKLMVKGEIALKLLYAATSDEAALETMEYAIPFSQMLDCDGITEDCACSVRLSVQAVELEIKNDYSGDKVFFEAQLKLFADAVAYRTDEVTVLTDAYSRMYDMNLSYRQRTLESLAEMVQDSLIQKSTFETDTGISKVLDIWNELCTVTAGLEEDKIVYKGKFNVCVLALDPEGKPFYLERMADFTQSRPWTENTRDLRLESQADLSSLDYRITGGGIEVKAEIRLTGRIFRQTSCRVVSEASADEDSPRERDTQAAICLYFADAGEKLWDIARSYCTSVSQIQQENDLSGDAVESRGMLLIPM